MISWSFPHLWFIKPKAVHGLYCKAEILGKKDTARGDISITLLEGGRSFSYFLMKVGRILSSHPRTMTPKSIDPSDGDLLLVLIVMVCVTLQRFFAGSVAVIDIPG